MECTAQLGASDAPPTHVSMSSDQTPSPQVPAGAAPQVGSAPEGTVSGGEGGKMPRKLRAIRALLLCAVAVIAVYAAGTWIMNRLALRELRNEIAASASLEEMNGVAREWSGQDYWTLVEDAWHARAGELVRPEIEAANTPADMVAIAEKWSGLDSWMQTEELWLERCSELFRAPEGMLVVVPVPGSGESSQPSGPGARAGWAWRVRHRVTEVDFLLVEPGSFEMGSPADDEERQDDEGPQRTVTLTQPFYLARTEVTQAQWERVMGTNPSHFTGDPDRPLESVSWDDCKPFLRRCGWSLPSEAEWEYACRAATSARFSSGDSDADLARVAWYSGNASGTTHPVGTKQANPWGFHDMHGNVGEWCRDYYSESYYGSGPSSDPENMANTSYRVLRGGGFVDTSQRCRSADRIRCMPYLRGGNGLRPRVGVTLR